ncbi:MAG: isoprenylcysteine carboxylmethyltransferase family protein [Pseudomonadota bacterium]
MDEVRFAMALFVTLLLPAILTFWLVIHGGIAVWRSTGVPVAFTVASIMMGLAISTAWYWRGELIGRDLGFNPWLTTAGAILYCATIVLSRPIRRHLSLRTFAGVPEIEQEAGDLIVVGPYTVVRHPRYTMVMAGIVGWCMVCNFLGTYLLGLASLAGFYGIAWLEEKELVTRFGRAYEDYQSRVPRLLPDLPGLKRLYLMG